MFEGLFFPNIKNVEVSFKDDPRWLALEAESNAIKLKSQQGHSLDTKALSENVKKQEALAKEYHSIVNGNYTQYMNLWQELIDTIEKDPMIVEYQKAHNGAPISKCFEELANHFKSEKADALAQQIEYMKFAYLNAKKIKDKKTESNTKFKETENGKQILSENDAMTAYVYNLNRINNQDMDTKVYTSYRKPAKSLLDEAYAYNESNNYEKVQTGQEALLAIRLGQLAQQMQTQTVAIENAGDLFDAEKDEELPIHEIEKYNNIIKGYDLEKGAERYSELLARREENQRIVEEMNSLKTLYDNKDYNALYDKFSEEIDELINEAIKPAVEKEIKLKSKEAEEKAIELGTQLYHIRKVHLEEYNQEYEEYEHDLKLDQETQAELDAAEAEMKPVLETYNAMLKAAEEKNADFEKQVRAEHDQQKQTYAEQTKKISELESKMTKLTEDFEHLHVALTNLAIDPDDLAQYNYKFIEFNTLDKMMKYVSNLLPGTNLNDRNAAFDLALGKHEIRDEDFINITGEEQKLLFNARVIQEGLKNLRTSDKDSDKDLCKRFDDIKKACVLSVKDSPSAMLGTQFQNLSYYINDFNRDHQDYFRAQNTIKTIRDNYNQAEPTQEDIDKLTSEITLLKDKLVVPASDKQLDEDLKAKKEENLIAAKEYKANTLDPLSAKVENYKDKFIRPSEPKKPDILSEEEIKDKIENERLKHCNKTLIESRIKGEFIEKNLQKCVISHVKNLINSKEYVSKELAELSNIKETIDGIYEFDKKQALKKDDTISQLNDKLEAFEVSKQQSYGYIAKAAKSLLDNMDKGKKPKHEDSAEFEAMKKGVSTVVGMFMDSKSTSADVMTTALINMREQARRYYDKKQEGIHLIPSNMRFVRLNMSQRIQKFANDMLGMMADLKNISDTMQKSIDVYTKSVSGRQIKGEENALEHFARCCKEAQKKPENKQIEKVENKEQICLV